MAFLGVKDLGSVSVITMVYGVVYGILLIVSQWAFAFSLKTGSAAVCAVIYALGFIFPTLSGAVFWGEVDLNGQIRPVAGHAIRATQAKRLGYKPIIFPHDGDTGYSTLVDIQKVLFRK